MLTDFEIFKIYPPNDQTDWNNSFLRNTVKSTTFHKNFTSFPVNIDVDGWLQASKKEREVGVVAACLISTDDVTWLLWRNSGEAFAEKGERDRDLLTCIMARMSKYYCWVIFPANISELFHKIIL